MGQGRRSRAHFVRRFHTNKVQLFRQITRAATTLVQVFLSVFGRESITIAHAKLICITLRSRSFLYFSHNLLSFRSTTASIMRFRSCGRNTRTLAQLAKVSRRSTRQWHNQLVLAITSWYWYILEEIPAKMLKSSNNANRRPRRFSCHPVRSYLRKDI
jgi:hypothetical protein